MARCKPVGLTKSARSHNQAPMPSCNCARTTSSGTLYNMSGFQTKLKYGPATEHLRGIPGLGKRRVCPLRRTSPQIYRLLNSPNSWTAQLRLGSACCRDCVLPADDRLARAMCESPQHRCMITGSFGGGELRGRSLAPPPATTALWSHAARPYHLAAISRPS